MTDVFDKKLRLFGKISIVDIGLVLLLVAFASAAVIFSTPQAASAKTSDEKITYVIELYKRKDGFINNVHVGDELFDSVRGVYIGEITDVSESPYMEDVPDFEADVFRRKPIDGWKYVYMTVKADAKISDSTTQVGQYDVLVGRDVYVKTKSFMAGGFIVKIERDVN